MFEAEAEKILRHAADNSTKFQKSIVNYLARKENSIGLVTRKIAEVDARLGEVEAENLQLDKRLSFLLKGGEEMAESFRHEYQKRFLVLKNEEQELESSKSQIKMLQKQIADAQAPSKNGGLEQINEALGYIRKKELVSLKSIYRRLFKKVVVCQLNRAKVELQFTFNNVTSPIRNGKV